MNCLCGCNKEVRKGKSYISGHNSRVNPTNKLPYPSIPSLCLCGCNEIVYNGKQWKNGHYSRMYLPISNLEKGIESRRVPVKPLGICKCGCGEITYNGKDYINGHHMKTKEYRERKALSAKKQWEDSTEEFKQRKKEKSSEVIRKLNRERNICSIGGQISLHTQAKNRHHVYDDINFLSKQETECYKILKSKFQDIKYGIKIGTKTIDFYIPTKDIFIEYHPKFINNKHKIEMLKYKSDRVAILRNNNISSKMLIFENLQEVKDYVNFGAFPIQYWG